MRFASYLTEVDSWVLDNKSRFVQVITWHQIYDRVPFQYQVWCLTNNVLVIQWAMMHLNLMMLSHKYKDRHYEDKPLIRPSYLMLRILYLKRQYLYWNTVCSLVCPDVNCAKCPGEDGSCEVCMDAFYLVNGTCVLEESCLETVLHCVDRGCEKNNNARCREGGCQEGYYHREGKCIESK